MAAPQDRLGKPMGEYRLLRLLGQGAFGAVYLAEHVHDGSQAAVKLLQVQLTHPEDFKAFLNEARTIRLRHPHIVPLLDFGLSDENQPFLVMEYAAGGTLRDRHARGSRLPLPTLANYVQQVASALQYAHARRIIHRDVKPENMLVHADGRLLLSDFGIATVAHSSRSINLQEGIGGTLPYMAPEQIQGQPRKESDQYALAVVAYEWIVGQRPFQGTAIEIAMQHAMTAPPSLLERVSTLSREVEQVVLKALAKEPKERFASIEQFAQALQAAIQSPPIPVPQNALVAPPSPSVAPTPSTPIPAAQSATELPTLAGMEVKTVSATEQSQERSRIPDTPLPQSDKAEPAPASTQADLAETLAASGLPTTSSLTSPTTSSTRAAWTPQPPSTSPARPEATRRSTLASGTRVSARIILMGMLAALVLLMSGAGLWTVGTQLQIQHRQQATATAQAAPFATATAAANAYRNAVERSGIQFGFDAQHTGNNPYERSISPANVSRLRPLWSYQTGNGIESSPAIANGVVYVGSDDNSLYALDATAGKKLWSFQTGDAITSSPAVANGVVYVGSWDGLLYALDATSGKKLWSFQISRIEPSPAIANGVVYVGSGDHSLYALDATSGKKLWSYQTGGFITSSPAVANGVVYVGSDDHSLYALDATAGKKLWSFQTGDFITSSPAVANGVVYVGSGDHSLYALDVTSGKKLWSFQTGNQIESSPAVANGVVYVGSNDHSLYALDATSGKKLWSFQTGDWIYSSPIANGVVYVGSWGNSLYALDATSGKKLWSFQTGNIIDSSPAVANGVVYVGSRDDKLYAFGIQGGA